MPQVNRGRRAFQPWEVDEIRDRYAKGESQGALARAYGVTLNTVGRVVRGETYQTNSRTRADQPIFQRLDFQPSNPQHVQELGKRLLALQKEVNEKGGVTPPPDDRKIILLTGLPPTAKRFTRGMYSDQDVVFIDDDPPEESDSQKQLAHPPETE